MQTIAQLNAALIVVLTTTGEQAAGQTGFGQRWSPHRPAVRPGAGV
jgi:hypothetical protein